jgi:alginate O-acetyltransferase complex protein AlgI
MDAVAFLADKPQASTVPTWREWGLAVAKTLGGAVLLWLVARCALAGCVLLRGWIGLMGLGLLLHFGVFHLLSCFWRSRGRNARPLMDWPIRANSVTEFWGRRWNTAFRELAHRFIFQPLSRLWGPRVAILAGFGASGLVHDLVISVPAGAGYGLPTLYFLFQGTAVLLERTPAARTLGSGRGWRGWLFTALVVAGPAVALFHPPFIHNVLVPFMEAVGALEG